MPGGLGQVNVMVSMLFPGISGSSTADAVGCGKISIPEMIKKKLFTSLCSCHNRVFIRYGVALCQYLLVHYFSQAQFPAF